jgi:hypothetical protein
MSLKTEMLGSGGAEIDFGTCGCRCSAAEVAELHVQLAFCLLGREFVGRTGEYPPVYVRAGDSPDSIRIATDNMAFEISRDDAEDLLAGLERAEAAGHPAHEAGTPDPDSSEWQVLGSVTIDTGTLLLIDPVHGGVDVGKLGESDHAQVPVPGGDFSAVLVGTGMGDGRYPVEGRFADCPFGRRVAEIRVRFLDDEGDYMGGDEE